MSVNDDYQSGQPINDKFGNSSINHCYITHELYDVAGISRSLANKKSLSENLNIHNIL